MNTPTQATVKAFFDPQTWTYTYVVYESKGSPCIVIDSVLNYDPKSGRTKTHSADEVISFIKDNRLQLEWILETHAHADHLTAAPYIQEKLGGKIAIGDHITTVQGVFKGCFNLDDVAVDGSQFDALIKEGESVRFGNLSFKALYVPGHTPACMAYEIGDSIFVGDTLFMPDVGTARCDFPGGSASNLYRSIQSILKYPPIRSCICATITLRMVDLLNINLLWQIKKRATFMCTMALRKSSLWPCAINAMPDLRCPYLFCRRFRSTFVQAICPKQRVMAPRI
jgi:glyoxylase-like metal-dependent hydrolase (beta-lactamase superfamily II)